MYPVTCSLLWVRCLFDRLSISDFGSKWPLKLKFSKMSFRIARRDTRTRLRFVTKFEKIGRCKVAERSSGLPQKKLWFRGTRPSPHFAQNYLNVVIPWHVWHVYRILSGSAAFRRTYAGKIDFSAPKSNYNNIVAESLYYAYRLSAYN